MADLSLDDILAQAENPAFVRTASVRVLLRQDLAARIEELDAELRAFSGDDSIATKAPALAEQIRDLEAEAEAAKVEFAFRAIGHRAWADLMAKHPPPKDKVRQWDHDPKTFPTAAMAACCIKPEGTTVESWQRLERALNESQFNLLWSKCVEANTGLDAPKSAAAGLIARLSGKSATIAAPEESPEASSSDE